MVGVCIKYMHENYGGILQAYATVSLKIRILSMSWFDILERKL